MNLFLLRGRGFRFPMCRVGLARESRRATRPLASGSFDTPRTFARPSLLAWQDAAPFHRRIWGMRGP